MNTHKKWAIAVLTGLALFIAANLCVWELFTKDLLTDNVKSGDYTRVGYITGSSYSFKREYYGAKRHIESHDYRDESVDLITLGDSFSNSCGKKGLYYQDWIASNKSLNVLNIQRLSGVDFFETIVIMLNSGFLDALHPKAVLIERVQRHVIEDFSKDFDMEETRPIEEVHRDFREIRFINHPPSIGFLNIGNIKFLLYSCLRKIRDNAFFSKVYRRDLERPLFNVRNERSLIWGYEDVGHLAHENDRSIKKVNDNLNALAEKLSKRGIKLYFMPVVDKYNLYSEFLVRNPYPSSHFFERMRPLPKKYQFIDTKMILFPLVARGEKDVYWADDSHWSWNAAETILKEIKF